MPATGVSGAVGPRRSGRGRRAVRRAVRRAGPRRERRERGTHRARPADRQAAHPVAPFLGPTDGSDGPPRQAAVAREEGLCGQRAGPVAPCPVAPCPVPRGPAHAGAGSGTGADTGPGARRGRTAAGARRAGTERAPCRLRLRTPRGSARDLRGFAHVGAVRPTPSRGSALPCARAAARSVRAGGRGAVTAAAQSDAGTCAEIRAGSLVVRGFAKVSATARGSACSTPCTTERCWSARPKAV